MLFGLQVLYTYDGQWQAEIWLHKYHDTLRRMISHGCLVCTSTVADSCSVKFQGSLLNSDSLWEACGLLPCLLCRIIMNHHVYSDCKPNVTTLRIYWRYIIICQFCTNISREWYLYYQNNMCFMHAHTTQHTHTSHRTSIAVLHKSVLFAACKRYSAHIGHTCAHCQSFLVPLQAEDKRHGSGSCVRCHKAAACQWISDDTCVHRPPIATVCYHVSIVSFHFSEF